MPVAIGLYTTQSRNHSATFLFSKHTPVGDHPTKSLARQVPEGCPTDCIFIPQQLRAWLITWVHTIPGTGNLSTQGTYLLQIKYARPNMLSDINKYASWYSMCALYKVPYPPPCKDWLAFGGQIVYKSLHAFDDWSLDWNFAVQCKT